MPERIITFEDSIMPRSTIKACARTVLHPDTSIKKEALTALAKGSSVFISYLTTYANDIATSKKRKTIMPNDVFDALKAIQFERFVADLKEQHEQAEVKIKDKKDRKKSGALPDPVEPLPEHDEEVEDADDESRPAIKKARVENSAGDLEMADDSDRMGNAVADVDAADEEQDEEEEDDDDDDDDSDTDDEDDGDDDDGDNDEGEGDKDVAGSGDHSRAVAAQLGAVELEDAADRVPKDDYDEVLDDGEDSD